MQYRSLGRTGLEVSEVGFGCAGIGLTNYVSTWDPQGDKEQQMAAEALELAIRRGVNYFDTAPLYGSEEILGRVLKPARDRILLATKVRETEAAAVRASIEASLHRLQTDHIDVIQYHGETITPEIMFHMLKKDGILTGMKAARDDGLVRFIGFTSEAANGAVSRLIDTDEFDTMQIQYNITLQHPYQPDKRSGVMFEAEARDMGIVVMRSMTAGVFDRWIRQVAPKAAELFDIPRAMLSFVLSNPLTDVALVDMRRPRWVERNCAISDDQSTRLDLRELYDRFSGP